MSVRADNDAFNFWRAITDRPDKEYTNGDQVTVEISRRAVVGQAVREAPRAVQRHRAVRRALPNDVAVDRPGHVHAEAESRAA